MNSRNRLLLTGCLGAVIMSALSCCALTGLAIAPAFGEAVPSPPVSVAGQPDITVIVAESYIDQTLREALPSDTLGDITLDVQPGNRLVLSARLDVLLAELDLVASLRLAVESGELQILVESIEAGGYDITNLIGMDSDELGSTIGKALQEEIEAGLGVGARLLGTSTTEDQIIFTARWEP